RETQVSTGPLYSTPPQVWIISPLMTLIVPTVACTPCMDTAVSAGAQGVGTHIHMCECVLGLGVSLCVCVCVCVCECVCLSDRHITLIILLSFEAFLNSDISSVCVCVSAEC